MKTLDITPSPRLLSVLGDIPLDPWQCLAELIDNSLDELLKQPTRSADNPLAVDISIEPRGNATYLVVTDNGSGMDEEELERSLRAGHSGKNRYGSLGLFGMGFNISTARLGTVTNVETTVKGQPFKLRTTIDFRRMQGLESFEIPVESLQCPVDESGTTVEVKLKPEHAGTMRRTRQQKILRQQLGDVYSFLLRDAVPGLNQSGHSSKIPAVLTLGGEQVTPKLPCVWSDERSVTSRGQEVHTVQFINVVFQEATACLDCGYWDRNNGPRECEDCGSTNLESRERRVWGWLGIQRYISSNHYGVDFLRYGRKILKQDKSIFTFVDPDTLQSEVEYPIEMPANKGRIIGEIHLDHVRVTYQKDNFDRSTGDWKKAIEELRGTGPLKPRAAATPNNSPLAILYSAYRRNDPGLRYLTPGDGQRAIHSKTEEWAKHFYKGVQRYQDDTEWLESAERHQRLKDGLPAEGEESTTANGESRITEVFGNLDETIQEIPDEEEQLPREDVHAHARRMGTEREDLSGTFNLGSPLGSYEIKVVVTRDPLEEEGVSVPASTGTIKGKELEVFVSNTHNIFTEFGRDVRDVALLHAATVIKTLEDSPLPAVKIYGDLVQKIQDLKTTNTAILDRIGRTLVRVRDMSARHIADDPDTFWSCLDVEEKGTVEKKSALKFPNDRFQDVVDDGRFIHASGARVIAKLIEEQPATFFDGVVFKPSLQQRSPAAKERLVGEITRILLAMASFQEDVLSQDDIFNIQLVQLNLDSLEDKLSDEDVLT